MRQLADKTAANVGTISVHLARLDANSREMAQRRAANISALYAANSGLRERYELDVALTRKTGGAPHWLNTETIAEYWPGSV